MILGKRLQDCLKILQQGDNMGDIILWGFAICDYGLGIIWGVILVRLLVITYDYRRRLRNAGKHD